MFKTAHFQRLDLSKLYFYGIYLKVSIFKIYLHKSFQVYWWAVILGSIAVIILFWLFVKCCAVHTKSSNPEVELRYPHRSVRQSVTSVRDTVIHPQQTFRASVRSVRGSLRSVSGSFKSVHGSMRNSLRRMSGRPVSSELDLRQVEEELEVLNSNPSTNVDDVFL